MSVPVAQQQTATQSAGDSGFASALLSLVEIQQGWPRNLIRVFREHLCSCFFSMSHCLQSIFAGHAKQTPGLFASYHFSPPYLALNVLFFCDTSHTFHTTISAYGVKCSADKRKKPLSWLTSCFLTWCLLHYNKSIQCVNTM